MNNNRRGVLEEMKFDVRVSEKLLQDGTLDTKEHEKYIKSLPDESANVAYMPVFSEAQEDRTGQSNSAEGLTFISG